jgi:hypothetical protein
VVGPPVTRRPPHRSGRAELPHPAPQSCHTPVSACFLILQFNHLNKSNLPNSKLENISIHEMCRLAVQLSYLIQLDFVRDMFPTTSLNMTVVSFGGITPPTMERSYPWGQSKFTLTPFRFPFNHVIPKFNDSDPIDPIPKFNDSDPIDLQ